MNETGRRSARWNVKGDENESVVTLRRNPRSRLREIVPWQRILASRKSSETLHVEDISFYRIPDFVRFTIVEGMKVWNVILCKCYGSLMIRARYNLLMQQGMVIVLLILRNFMTLYRNFDLFTHSKWPSSKFKFLYSELKFQRWIFKSTFVNFKLKFFKLTHASLNLNPSFPNV